MRDKVFGEFYPDSPDQFSEPPDLKNLGVKCQDCKSPKVIYYIAVPAPSFPTGPYCYKCLLNHCRLAHRIPLPMENNLLDSLQRDLGLAGPGKKFFFMGTAPLP